MEQLNRRTPDGHLLSYDNFAASEASSRLQKKGQTAVVQPRFGMRLPFFSDSWTLSLGGYQEKSRWEGQEDLGHTTGGLSYKFAAVKFLGMDLKGPEILVGMDVAKDYSTFFATYR